MISNIQLRFHAERSFEAKSINIYAAGESRDGKTEIVKPIFLEPWAEGEYIPPMMSLSMEEASRLMDALWYAGLRPSDGSGSHATHEAMQAHINNLTNVLGAVLKDYKNSP